MSVVAPTLPSSTVPSSSASSTASPRRSTTQSGLNRFLATLRGHGAYLVTDQGTLTRVFDVSPEAFESLFRLHTAAMRPEVERLTPWDEAKQRSRLTSTLETGVAFVAWDGDRALGACLLSPGDATSFELSYLYVTPERHGDGFGTAILRSLQETCGRLGLSITLGVLKQGRPRPLYERLGWILTGENRWEDTFRWSPVSPT